jgi:hypothetical protein
MEWLGALQPQTPAGREPMGMGTPDARSGHTCCVMGGRLYLLGGWDRTTFLNDAWMLDRCVRPSTPWNTLRSRAAFRQPPTLTSGLG